MNHLDWLSQRLRPYCSISAFSQTLLLAVAFGYLFSLGSTWSASVNGDYAKPTAMLFATMIIVGALGHFIRGLTWRKQVLDQWVWLWLGVIATSSVFNSVNAFWNILHAVWFCAALWLVWAVASDLITNNVLTRTTLADALLLGSLYPVWSGIQTWSIGALRDQGFSTLNNANYYATFLEFLIPLAWVRWSTTRNVLRLLLLLALLAGAFVSGSRGFVLALGGALLFIDRKRRWKYLGGAIPLIAVLILVRPNTVLERIPIYQYAVNEFLNSPIWGNGPFTFRFTIAHQNSIQAHNLCLHIASELGTLGLALFGFQILWLWKVYRRIEDPMQMAWAASLVMTSAHQMADVTWVNPGMSLLLVLALTASVETSDTEPRPPRKLQLTYTVLIIALAITLYVFAWRNGGVHQETLTGVVGW